MSSCRPGDKAVRAFCQPHNSGRVNLKASTKQARQLAAGQLQLPVAVLALLAWLLLLRWQLLLQVLQQWQRRLLLLLRWLMLLALPCLRLLPLLDGAPVANAAVRVSWWV